MKKFIVLNLFFILILLNCSVPQEPALFTQLEAVHTGIDFRNDILETKEFNILDYLYFYNGGGVSTGDINNDGFIEHRDQGRYHRFRMNISGNWNIAQGFDIEGQALGRR